MSRMLKRLLCSALLALSSAGPVFAADTIEIYYPMPRIGLAFSYFGMGFNDEDGNFVSLAGQQIVSSRVVLDFTPDPGVDVANLHMDITVPVTGAPSQFFGVLGTQMIETTPGTWHYELTTDQHNGTVYAGRFGSESYGLDPDGNAVSMAGVVAAGSGYYFTVTYTPAVPEPGTALMLLGGLALVPLVARRRRSEA